MNREKNTELRSKLLSSYFFFLLLLIGIIWLSFGFYQQREKTADTMNQLNQVQSLFLQVSRIEKHFYAYELTDTVFFATTRCAPLQEHQQLLSQLQQSTQRLAQSGQAADK